MDEPLYPSLPIEESVGHYERMIRSRRVSTDANDNDRGASGNSGTLTNAKSDHRSHKRLDMQAKSLFWTYFWWLFGGVFGLHHFYLGRDRHAFITWITAGGYFGCGWLRDLWRIPEYVRDVNEDPEYMKQLKMKMRRDSSPSSSYARDGGAIIVADIFGYLAMSAIPNELIPEWLLKCLIAILVPIAIAIGVHLVGNVGRHEGNLKTPVAAALCTAPIYFWFPNSIFLTSLVSYWAFCRSRTWREKYPRPRPLYKRMTILTLASLLYLSLWASWGYFNCTLTDKDGQEYKCRDSFRNSLNSPFFLEFKSVMKDLWTYLQYHGVRGLWAEFMASLDPSGEQTALKVLNLTSSASQEEITARYRNLSRQWHPDRHKDPVTKAMASEKFVEINKAYETLSQIKSRRLKKNQKADLSAPHQFHEEL